MLRTIITIDEALCNGCGACARACHEGAIEMVDGKARLTREHYCDGLGDCLPACPTGAIHFERREAPAYDEAAVRQAQAAKTGGCPGAAARRLQPQAAAPSAPARSQLAQWPVQIKLTATQSPAFDNAHLLIAADCTAYAYAAFHQSLMQGRATLIGCPKLDDVDYSEKLAHIFAENQLKSVTVARMEVPCCGGLEYAVRQALQKSGSALRCRVVTISIDGEILSDVTK